MVAVVAVVVAVAAAAVVVVVNAKSLGGIPFVIQHTNIISQLIKYPQD
jgi:hypothetical protein